jgi:hypothetical protein
MTTSSGPHDLERRLWRVRRQHHYIDAELYPSDAGWALEFSRDGRRMVTRSFSSREEAADAADARLREFQRVGWTQHW